MVLGRVVDLGSLHRGVLLVVDRIRAKCDVGFVLGWHVGKRAVTRNTSCSPGICASDTACPPVVGDDPSPQHLRRGVSAVSRRRGPTAEDTVTPLGAWPVSAIPEVDVILCSWPSVKWQAVEPTSESNFLLCFCEGPVM